MIQYCHSWSDVREALLLDRNSKIYIVLEDGKEFN